MPVQVDAPTFIATWDEWGLWGTAPDKLSAVATNDGDTSVIYAASGGRGVYQGFQFPFLGGIGDPVTSASVSAIVREYAHGAGHAFYVLFGHVDPIGGDVDQASTVHDAGGGYTTISQAAAGIYLGLGYVNTHHGLVFQGAGGSSNKAEFWVTQFYRTVSYGYGSAGGAGPFTHLIGSIAGAFIGSGLSLREMTGLSAFMRSRAKRWLRPDEYEDAWRAWRSFTHPRSVCL